MFRPDFEERIATFFESIKASYKIAIQISDKYLAESVAIHNFLSSLYPSKYFFIISDSSFNDCCVDYISAQHLEADAIIHFGPYCTSSYSIPICFLPDFEASISITSELISTIDFFIENVKSSNLLIILDQTEISRNAFADLCKDKSFSIFFAETLSNQFCSNNIFGFYISIDKSEFTNTSLIYIGPHEKLSTDLGCIFYNNQSLRIDSRVLRPFDGSISRELAKRSCLIDSIRCFDHVGILVENPNVQSHVQVAQYLQNICTANDIISDIIYVGRLNEMKLGNFADIDFFIHLSCPGRSLFSFVRPVVSPLEFLCAKFDLNFWENQCLLDYRLFIKYCHENKNIFLKSYGDDNNFERQLVIKNFFELSTQLFGNRKNYSYNGLEINSAEKEIKLHQGAVGNSTAYDYESNK